MHGMGTIRRIRRVGPGTGSGRPPANSISNATTRTPEHGAAHDGWDWDGLESTASTTANGKHEKASGRAASNLVGSPPRNSAGGGAMGAGTSLSEKLRQQERLEQQQQQQERRGPLTDSDHLNQKVDSGAGGSVDSGWSWASSSRGTCTAADTKHFTGANDKFLRGRLLASAGPSGSDQNASRFSLLRKVASSIPGPFKNTRRTGYMVCQAFRESDSAKHRVLSAMNCQKNAQLYGGDEGRALSWRLLLRMGPLVALIMLGGTFQLGRRRGHRLGEAEQQRATSAAAASSSWWASTSASANEQHLRGDQQRSGVSPPDGASDAVVVHRAVFPPHLSHLANLTAPYDPGAETPYFWDVPLSGESVAEAVFARCHGLVQACEFGLRQPDYNEEKLELFELDDTHYVNVDLQQLEGIQRAAALGLAPAHLADVIISPHLHSVSSQIFSYPGNPGRMFALFRHPVHRALSLYFYLSKATWDPRYNPKLEKMSVENYAKSKYIENNWLTRFLVDKPGGKLTLDDMLLAKKIIKFKCLVGLFDDLQASLVRFEQFFGWNLKESGSSAHKQKAEISKCRSLHVARGDKHMLHKEGTAVREGSVAWNAIVRMNIFDMELYEFVRKIYRIQGEQIFDVVGHEVLREDFLKDSSKEETSMELQSSKSMETTAHEGNKVILNLATQKHRAANRSTTEDAFEDGVFQPSSGKSMTLDLDHKGASQPGNFAAVIQIGDAHIDN